jgi:hypothetical protein
MPNDVGRYRGKRSQPAGSACTQNDERRGGGICRRANRLRDTILDGRAASRQHADPSAFRDGFEIANALRGEIAEALRHLACTCDDSKGAERKSLCLRHRHCCAIHIDRRRRIVETRQHEWRLAGLGF